MDSFAALKRIALDKRNKAIADARAEYRMAVEQIDNLRHTLGLEYHRPSKTNKPVMDLIRELLPRKQMFTVGDVVTILKDCHPDRTFNVPTIRTFFPRLEDLKEIRRVSRDSCGHVLWAVADFKVDETPFGPMAATDVAEKILREQGPKRLVELVVEMQRQGFRPDTKPQRIASSLRTCAKQRPGRFLVVEGGRWTVAGEN